MLIPSLSGFKLKYGILMKSLCLLDMRTISYHALSGIPNSRTNNYERPENITLLPCGRADSTHSSSTLLHARLESDVSEMKSLVCAVILVVHKNCRRHHDYSVQW